MAWDLAAILICLVVFFGGLILALANNEYDLGKLAHGEIRKIISIYNLLKCFKK